MASYAVSSVQDDAEPRADLDVAVDVVEIGLGDVLSGILGGLLAQGLEMLDAAKAAVYIHGLAGDLAIKETTEMGLVASDIIKAIPQALKAILK